MITLSKPGLKRAVLRGIMRLMVLLFLYIIAVGVIHRAVRVRLKSGDLVEMKPDSIFRSFDKGSCEIHIRTASRKKARIVLYQDFCDGPMIVVPGASPNVYFCVFDADIDVQLLRIELDLNRFSLLSARIS